jgi:hypothetical protein
VKDKQREKTTSPAKTKSPFKITIPLTRQEIYKGLDMVLDSKTPLSRALPDVLGQALWSVKCQNKEHQSSLAAGLIAFLDAHVSKGGVK